MSFARESSSWAYVGVCVGGCSVSAEVEAATLFSGQWVLQGKLPSPGRKVQADLTMRQISFLYVQNRTDDGIKWQKVCAPCSRM